MYPFGERAKPTPTRFIHPEGRTWSRVPPRGFAYFERLNDILQREPVFERDRMIMVMLKALGIEKGVPFNPDARQRKILEDGARMGEMMGADKVFRQTRKGSALSARYALALRDLARSVAGGGQLLPA